MTKIIINTKIILPIVLVNISERMKKMTKGKKIISVLLVLCIAVSAIGFSVFAADNRSTAAQPTEVKVEMPDMGVLKNVIDKYFGGPELFAKFMAGTVGQIVTGTYSDHLAEVIVNAYYNGIIIGDIGKMTDEEVKAMLDQIYWVYADNPGPITQTVDCIKMFVNWSDAAIHWGQDGILGEMQKKLETYYRNWLLEHCMGLIPEIPTKPTEPPVTETEPPVTETEPPETTTETEPPETSTEPPETSTETEPPETSTEPPETSTETEPPETSTEPPVTETESTPDTTEGEPTVSESEPAETPDVPTGDSLAIALVVAAAAVAGGAIIISKKSRKAE